MSYDLFTYPLSAGFKENTTSRDAAEAIEGTGRAATLRQRVLRCFDSGEHSPDDVAEMLSEQPFAIRPRITELFQLGMIERTGARRLSHGGRLSHVFRRVR